MPVIRGVGQGQETPRKLMQLEGLMRWHVGMASGKFKEMPYIYIDLNAGNGLPVAGRDELFGSPVIAARILHEKRPISSNSPYMVVCIEQDAINRNSLDNILLQHHNWLQVNQECIRVVTADNASVITDVLNGIKKFYDGRSLNGLILHDPTGVPDIELLSKLQNSPPRMDILIYAQATSVKRVRSAMNSKSEIDIRMVMAYTGKKYWLIREPSARHQWTFLMGTNWDGFKEWRKQGFYRLETPEGAGIFNQLNLTAKERATNDAT